MPLDPEQKKREMKKALFKNLKKEGSPGLPEEKKNLSPKRPQPKLVDRGSYLEQNALDALFPGMDLSQLEDPNEMKKKKLKLADLMSKKLQSKREEI